MDVYRTAARESLRKALNDDDTGSYVLDAVSSSTTHVSPSELLRDIRSNEPKRSTTATAATDACEDLLVAEAWLSVRGTSSVAAEDESEGEEAVTSLFSWVAQTVLPSDRFVGFWEQSQLGGDAEEAKDSAELKAECLKSSIGTAVLHRLNSIISIYELDHAVQLKVITALAAFTRRTDPWTTEKAFNQASAMLDMYRSAVYKTKDGSLVPLVGDILKDVVKPAFAKTKNPAITPAGRRAEHPVPTPRFDPSLFDEGSKPWKFKDVYVVTVLTWIIEQYHTSDYSLIEAQFPFLVPPILSLIDDDSLAYKAAGCDILHRLLSPLAQAKSDILRRTNLDSVFQDALSPCLLSLPSITPENESIHLLKAAYPALFSVIQTRFPTTSQEPTLTTTPPQPDNGRGTRKSSSSKKSQSDSLTETNTSLRVAALTRILRHSILPSYHHTSNPRPLESSTTTTSDTTTATASFASYPYPSLSTLLLSNLAHVTFLLGAHITPYLQDLLPVLTETLTNPFGTARPALFLAAARAAREAVAAGWMRIWRWRAEVLRGVCACWVHIEQDEGDIAREQGREGVRQGRELRGVLRDVVRLLRVAVEEVVGADDDGGTMARREAGGGIVVEQEFKELVQADETLEGLLFPDQGD